MALFGKDIAFVLRDTYVSPLQLTKPAFVDDQQDLSSSQTRIESNETKSTSYRRDLGRLEEKRLEEIGEMRKNDYDSYMKNDEIIQEERALLELTTEEEPKWPEN